MRVDTEAPFCRFVHEHDFDDVTDLRPDNRSQHSQLGGVRHLLFKKTISKLSIQNLLVLPPDSGLALICVNVTVTETNAFLE